MHQLCLFHATRRVVHAVNDVVKQVRRSLPTPPPASRPTLLGSLRTSTIIEAGQPSSQTREIRGQPRGRITFHQLTEHKSGNCLRRAWLSSACLPQPRTPCSQCAGSSCQATSAPVTHGSFYRRRMSRLTANLLRGVLRTCRAPVPRRFAMRASQLGAQRRALWGPVVGPTCLQSMPESGLMC
jgi:hypothetical protein